MSTVDAFAFPLSFAQRRLWFLSRLEPESAFYNMPLTLALNGPLDVSALERTLAAIVARHETLRTRFIPGDPEPQQIVSPAGDVPLPLIDLSHLPDGERGVEARRLATQAVRRPFDLERGPLFRGELIRVKPNEHVLVLVMHHIISDGWSRSVLYRELGACYRAFAAGEPSPLSELTVQYADFALWQRDWLSGAVYDAQLAYWRNRLAGAPSSVTLPTDRQRPARQSYRGGSLSIDLPLALVDELRAFSRREGASLFMTLLAAFKVVLARHTGETDLVVGSPIANRTRPELEALIGFFVNSLALRTDCSGNPTFRELVRRVRETALGAYAHQDMPFERLVEELRPERLRDRNPLFQVMFTLQNMPQTNVQLAGLTLRRIQNAHTTSKFDLTLYNREVRGGLRCSMEYAADLFDPDTIGRMLGHYRSCLESVAANPELRLAALPLLTEQERQQVVGPWGGEPSEFPAERGLAALFEAQVATTPEAIAVFVPSGSLSYADVNRRANQLGRALRRRGVGPEVRVGVALERSPELVIALLGIVKAGGAYVPLDPAYPEGRLRFMLEDAEIAALVTDAGSQGGLPDIGVATLDLDRDAAELAAERSDDLGIEVAGDHLAYVMYTSGSTGQPKGVAVPHRAIVRLVCNADYVQLHPDDCVAQVSNASFDAMTFELWGALLHGARLVIISKDVALSPPELASELRRSGVSAMFLTTALFNQVSKETPAAFSTVRHLLFGGEAVDPQWVREVLQRGAPERLLHVYGPTECTTFSTWHRVTDVPLDASTVPIGRPIANTVLRILDPQLNPVPVGVPGELYIGGPGLARGYLGRPRLTAQRFIPDPCGREPGARLYRTGDRVRWRADRTVEFLDRLDHQVKLRGFRVELGEIEAAIARHPGVREGVVTLREDSPGDKRLVAYVVPRDNGRSSNESQGVLQKNHVAAWQSLYEQLYDTAPVNGAEAFNTVGWNSSYTGEPIPPAEMHEWLDRTIERIRRVRLGRVLEIGCGTGLLLLRLAPDSETYTGTDFSAGVLRRLEAEVCAAGLSDRVTLLEREANDCSGFVPGSFDLVILNSVTQYLPSIDYLTEVLGKVAELLAPGGSVFVGDVRNFDLLQAFHTSVELHRASAAVRPLELAGRVQAQTAAESELTISPRYFAQLPAEIRRFRWVEVMPKRGRASNELTRFRYEAVLHLEPPAGAAPAAWLSWDDGWALERLNRVLSEERPPILALRRIPNSRVAGDAAAARALASDAPPTSLVELRQIVASAAGVDPEDLWVLGEELGYRTELSWPGGDRAGSYDAWFSRTDVLSEVPVLLSAAVATRSSDELANQPTAPAARKEILTEVRAFLRAELPEYMVPAPFVGLDALPLSPNGKVDRRALRALDSTRHTGRVLASPSTPTEERLAPIWSELLGVDRVGSDDDFFDLGGHSLLAVRLFAAIEAAFGHRLPLATLFQAPTMGRLAAAIDAAAAAKTAAGPIVVLQPHGTLPPLFWAHDIDGRLLCYRHVVRHFGASRPVYGFESVLGPGAVPPFLSIEQMAAEYVGAMRKVQPTGPYHVAGYCWGAGLAFEMARQLVRQEADVGFVGLIEGGVPGRARRVPMLARLRRQLQRLTRLPWSDVPRFLQRRLRNLWGRVGVTFGYRLSAKVGRPLLPELRDLRVVHEKAMYDYSPGVYHGRVTVFRIPQAARRASNDLGWGQVVEGGVEVHEISGEHLTVIEEPHAAKLAERLRACLDRETQPARRQS